MPILLRNISKTIHHDLGKKILLVTGPRQIGKTTLVKSLSSNSEYLNYDLVEHREIFRNKDWSREKDLVIFDELHKMSKWKTWLKGIYDLEGTKKPAMVVTGSARLDISRKMGDSLAGRHFLYRLLPLDLKEILANKICDSSEAISRLMSVGGFPEPFLENSLEFYNKWKRTHLDVILRQDLLDLENTTNIVKIEYLVELLRQRVGTVVSRDSLAKILEVSPHTIKKWLDILENLYVIFSVATWSTSVDKSLVKAKKYYFYDTGQVSGDIGASFENLVAVSLLKYIYQQEDSGKSSLALYFLRNKLGQEIDFAVCSKQRPLLILETKWNDSNPDTNFKAFSNFRNKPEYVQLVGKHVVSRDTAFGLKIRTASEWLADFEICA
jgi:predicted AAA+ superfamily ATPase